jgi:hypothetical protein
MPAQCVVRCIRDVVRKEMTQKSIAHLAFLFGGRSLRWQYWDASGSCPARTKEAKTGQKSRTPCIFFSLLLDFVAPYWQYRDVSGSCPARTEVAKTEQKSRTPGIFPSFIGFCRSLLADSTSTLQRHKRHIR